MRKWIAAASAAIALTLAACTGTMPASSTSSNSGSVEVFGTIDTGIAGVR